MDLDTDRLLKVMDRIVHEYTGNHLNDIQARVLVGAIANQRYADIAMEHNCTQGYVRDTACQLWKILSDYVGEPINKSNVATTLRRKGMLDSTVNINHTKNNPGYGCAIGSVSGGLRFSFNSRDDDEKGNVEDLTTEVLKGFKQNTADKLRQLGLEEEQIAEILDLSPEIN
jgi:hypothetical protein